MKNKKLWVFVGTVGLIVLINHFFGISEGTELSKKAR